LKEGWRDSAGVLLKYCEASFDARTALQIESLRFAEI
jgi:hypothetical protein